jgi:hypothetical protein
MNIYLGVYLYFNMCLCLCLDSTYLRGRDILKSTNLQVTIRTLKTSFGSVCDSPLKEIMTPGKNNSRVKGGVI